MNLQRIRAIAHRYFWSRITRFEDIVDFIFWPLLDMIVWGGVGLVMERTGGPVGSVGLSVLCAVMMRVFTYCYVNSAGNFLYEMMARNIINLFATPLTFNEFIVGAMLSSTITTVFLIAFSATAAWCIFGMYILKAGFGLIVFIIPLLISAWAISHISMIVLMVLGVHAQRLIFVLAWLLMPFSGVYYSLAVMPYWIQAVAQGVPMSYIFEALRIFILEGHFSPYLLAYAYGLSLFYFVITLIACNLMFERSRRLGLASLERA